MTDCPNCAARPADADRGEWCGNGDCSDWTNHPPPVTAPVGVTAEAVQRPDGPLATDHPSDDPLDEPDTFVFPFDGGKP